MISAADLIVAAAERLFVEHGFRATTMEAIAEAAGMSKVTVYDYYPDKDAVFAAVADNVAVRLIEAVRTGLAGDRSVRERVCGRWSPSTN